MSNIIYHFCESCKKELNQSNRKFCCKSCSATYNNKLRKKFDGKICIDCDKKVHRKNSRCREHYRLWSKQNGSKDMTLKDAIYDKHHRSSAYALVRSRARTIAKELNLTTCAICGYNKHVEIAHKKAISEFDESVFISEINSIDNLMPLCPNCHWEYDNIK